MSAFPTAASTIGDAAALTGLAASTLRSDEPAEGQQGQLLAAQERRLVLEAEHVASRPRYVRLTIDC